MPPALIAGAATIGGALISAGGAKSAAKTQAESNAQAIAEQRRQFDLVQQLLAPYVQAGNAGLSNLLAITGAAPSQTNWQAYAQSNPALMQAFQAQGGGRTINMPGMFGQEFNIPGQDLATFAQQWQRENDPNADLSAFQTGGVQAQQQAIAQLEQSPTFQALARQGEQSILQNASATGGLRGGNVQGALAQFRPAMLNQQIQQQIANFAGLASLGQNAASGTGNAGISTGANISNLLSDTGQARAYGALGSGLTLGNAVAGLGTQLGSLFGGSGGGLGRLAGSAASTIAANPDIF